MIPGILVALGLASLSHPAQLIDHLLKSFLLAHRQSLVDAVRSHNGCSCRDARGRFGRPKNGLVQ